MNIKKAAGATSRGPLYKHSLHIALRVVAGQIVVAIAIALGLVVTLGGRFGYSALVGAGIGILPTYYLAIRLFKQSARSPEQVLRGIYVGESIKVIFTLALFVLAILVLDIELWVVAMTYIATVMVNWIAVLFADLGESPRNSA